MKKRILSLLMAGLLCLQTGAWAAAEELTGGEPAATDEAAALAENPETGFAAVSEATELSEDILGSQEAEDSEITSEETIEEDLPAMVGDSPTIAEAHVVLKHFLTHSGFYSDGSYSIINTIPDGTDADCKQTIQYLSYADMFKFISEVSLGSYYTGIVEMYVAYGMDEAVQIKYTLKGESQGSAETSLPHPAEYNGSEKLNFTVNYNTNITISSLQEFANSSTKAGFSVWNKILKGVCNESIPSIGFWKWTDNPVASLSAPTITGYYNSVKGGDLRWTSVPNATGYYIYRNRKADGGNLLCAIVPGGDTTQYIDPDIRTGCWGRVYVYTVVAFNSNVKSPKSNAVTLQRLAPMAITGCSYPSSGSVTLKWAITTGENKAHGYQIQYARTKEDLYNRTGTFKTNNVTGRKNLSRTIKGLAKGTWYFRIRCYVDYTHSVTHVTTRTWSQYSEVAAVKINY